MAITICIDRTYIGNPLADLMELHKRRYMHDLWYVPDNGDSRGMNAISDAEKYADSYDALLEKIVSNISDLDKSRYQAERERMFGCSCMAWVYYEINRGTNGGGLRSCIKARMKSNEQLLNAEERFKKYIAVWEEICRKSGETGDYLSLFWAYCKMYVWELEWRDRLDEQLEKNVAFANHEAVKEREREEETPHIGYYDTILSFLRLANISAEDRGELRQLFWSAHNHGDSLDAFCNRASQLVQLAIPGFKHTFEPPVRSAPFPFFEERKADTVGVKNLLHYAKKIMATAKTILGRIYMESVASLAEEAKLCLEGEYGAIASSSFWDGYPAGSSFFDECVPYPALLAPGVTHRLSLQTWPEIVKNTTDTAKGIKQLWFDGYHSLRENQPEKAAAAFEAALEIPAKSAEDWNDRGLVLWALTWHGGGDPHAVQEAFEQAVMMAPEVGDFWTNLGVIREIREDVPNALSAYRKAIALDTGKSSHSWSNMASALFYLGHRSEAAEAAREALQLDNNNIGALFILGRLHRYAAVTEKTTDFLDKFFALAKEKDMWVAAFWNAGLIAIEETAHKEAENFFGTALEHYPELRSEPFTGYVSYQL